MTNDSGFCHNNYIGGLVPDLLPTVCFKLHTNMLDASQSFLKIFELNLNLNHLYPSASPDFQEGTFLLTFCKLFEAMLLFCVWGYQCYHAPHPSEGWGGNLNVD